MNTILEKTQELKTSILRFGTQARVVIREVCTFEFLGFATMLLPALMASVGFFFGKTVTPVYFWSAVAILTYAAFLAGWRRGLAYLALLVACTALTMYTFSYTYWDAQTYHFPMQYLLRQGWNPVFDSTVEKFDALAGDAYLWCNHALFLPKFNALCGAIVASAFGLFVGDGFLGHLLTVCLFCMSVKFARRYWSSRISLSVLFAVFLVLEGEPINFLGGQVDYATYASFCISALALVLYLRDRRLADLVLFVVATCICMTLKTTGILNCGLLVILTLPLLYKRISYWRALFVIGILVAIVGASPLLTNWIQYGSPFYPSMTFDPNIAPIDITSDFTGNADALSMGYLSRICYAWVSPKLTVAAIRWLEGNPDFNPVFTVGCGGCGVYGRGQSFAIMLLFCVVLLAVSRRNVISWLCVVVFISANFVPLKYIGYSRYFPQIGAIIPLATMNFLCGLKKSTADRWTRFVRIGIAIFFCAVLLKWFVLTFVSLFASYGRLLVQERLRQNMIATFPQEKPVRVSERDYRFTSVQRFRQAGLQLVKSSNGDVDTVIMNRNGLWPCYDSHLEVYKDLDARFPNPVGGRSLMRFHWLDVFDNLPHVLWDDNAKWNCHAKGVAK